MDTLSISRALAPILAGCIIALGYIDTATAVAPHAGPYVATMQPGPHALPRVTIDSKELFQPLDAETASRMNKWRDGCVDGTSNEAGCQCLSETLPFVFTWFSDDPWQLFVDSQRAQAYVGLVAASLVEEGGYDSEAEYRFAVWENAASENAACGLPDRSLYHALK